jgi:hypothetical protein
MLQTNPSESQLDADCNQNVSSNNAIATDRIHVKPQDTVMMGIRCKWVLLLCKWSLHETLCVKGNSSAGLSAHRCMPAAEPLPHSYPHSDVRCKLGTAGGGNPPHTLCAGRHATPSLLG